MAGITETVTAMKTISLNDESEKNTFNAKEFFNKYKTAPFLNTNYRNNKSIIQIMEQGPKLHKTLGTMQPGELLKVEGMFLSKHDPTQVIIKKSNKIDESDINSMDFTLRRLRGLAAATLFEASIDWFSFNLSIVDSEAIGLTWNDKDRFKAKLYLSAVSGAELFINIFDYFPLVCALRKYQMKYISKEKLLTIANMKFDTGETMAARCMRQYKLCGNNFTIGEDFDLTDYLHTLPKDVKGLFAIPQPLQFE